MTRNFLPRETFTSEGVASCSVDLMLIARKYGRIYILYLTLTNLLANAIVSLVTHVYEGEVNVHVAI